MEGLRLENVTKTYGRTTAVKDVSFTVQEGEIVAVLGPSGSGKSTLLYIIAGLEDADRGVVYWNDENMSSVPPYRRNFGLMFQDFALFPHRSVFSNVAFALQIANRPREEIDARVEEMLELVGLPGFGERDVNTLSGGEQQRVALARALAPRPRLLMLDEPLGSLDRNLRERLVTDLQKILRRVNQTALYVTHDQEEAFTLADRVALLREGMLEQMDTPQAMYLEPASPFVARFLGLTNLMSAVAHGDHAETPLGKLPLPEHAQGEITLLLRPERVRLGEDGVCELQGEILETNFQGRTCRAVIAVNGTPLTFTFPSNTRLPEVGNPTRIAFDPKEALQVLLKE